MLTMRSQAGWVLIDSVASAAIVVMAFTGTFLALDASNKTATRDVKKSTALIVAQNELDKMRDQLSHDPTIITQLENSTGSVTYQGTDYGISRRAYYVTGLGGDQTTACGKEFDGTSGSTPKFIYLKVSIAHNGSTSTAAVDPTATLDVYFAPEGGSKTTNTATLRIYVLDLAGSPINPGTQQVQLHPELGSPKIETANEFGCVLFVGLERGTYDVRIPNNKYNLFMEKSPVGSAITSVPIKVPQRAALSKDIRLESPVYVEPTFKVNNGGGDQTVIPSNASAHVGPWVALNEKINRESGTDYITLPGSVFMPHTAPLPANGLYPDPDGYGAYAGACDVNDPDDGIAANGSERVVFPDSGSAGSWLPNTTLTPAPELWLSQIRARAYAYANTAGTFSGGYVDQSINPGSVKVAVRLKADAGGQNTNPRCGSRQSSHHNNYVRLPGGTDAWGYLSDEAESLPTGRYDICIRVLMHYRYRIGWPLPWSTTNNQARYLTLSNQDLGYRSALAPSFDFSHPPNSSTSDCAGGQVNWS